MIKALCGLSLFFVCGSALSMDFESIKLSIWKKGETILGEEFVAATESVADYVNALPRPDKPFQANQFNCQVKGRAIHPSVNTNGPSPTYNSWTSIITIYEIKDCVAVRD